MPTVTISVDCEAASMGKCYTRELVRAAEEFTAPLTWLIFASEKDPLSNISLYHNEFYHRIPSWHEFGLLLGFEDSSGYVSDPALRGDIIRVGRDAVKQFHIKPTAFRAHRADLQASDLRHLEDLGFVVDATPCPGAREKHEVSWPEGPTQPYHPSYENLSTPGDAAIWLAPIAGYRGVSAYLDLGWEKVRPIIEHSLANDRVANLALSDYVDSADTLRKTLALCREKGARIVTLTQMASEL